MDDQNQTHIDSVVSEADGRAWVDQEVWQALAQSEDSEHYFSAWLTLQCARLSACRGGLVLAETAADETFAAAAIWPESQGVSEALLDVARSSLDEGEAIVVDLHQEYGGQLPVSTDSVALAFPLKIQERVVCVAALELGDKQQQDLESVMRQLQWGVSWLESYFLRDQLNQDESTLDRLVTALYLTAIVAKEPTAKQAMTSLVTEMATRLGCERVSCGFKSGRHIKLASMSHTGQFGRQMNLVNAIARAMDEALQQNLVINYPEPEGNGVITHNHHQLAGLQNGGAIMSVPLVSNSESVGALCIESADGTRFDEEVVQMCDSIASMVAPVLQDKRLNDRWVITKLKDSFLRQLGRLFGPRYLGRKFLVLLLAGVIAGLYVADGDFKITADAVLEGAEQRAVVTPYDGFIESSIRRVGDTVRQGELLATLDDTDLRLDLVELSSERAQAQSQYDQATAEYSRAKAKIYAAKIAQADARIALLKEKLKRTQLVAPLDGIIVKGDLSQSLGAAISRGEPLFEISSLNAYRVNLLVDERDIGFIKPGQEVDIVLSALPDRRIVVQVESITPVTRAAEGRNFFKVEASLLDKEGILRPGMEGVSKIHIEQRRYAWIWTRELVNWFKLWFWRWME